ncbi:MAG: class I SAM-dependent methyltransferase [Thermomicrobiales bacterium]|nr:class I SAM-dependent methyltransferase [Thermomicrobiales bacterium]
MVTQSHQATPESYALGSTASEHERLRRQAAIFRPATTQLLRQAGLAPGLRVLDAGCGVGDVTLIAAELVAPGGEVVAVDRDPAVLEQARARCAEQAIAGVTFVQAALEDLPNLGTFDAVVGRLVLMYQPDPAALLRRLVRHVRPGGIVAFQELDLLSPMAWPEAPLYTQVFCWLAEAFRAAGADPQMGMKLYTTFRAAGLPGPELETTRFLAGGPDGMICAQGAMVVRSLLPVILAHGIATEDEVSIDTLEERLRAEMVAGGGVVSMPMHVGARTRLRAAAA